ncbi:glycosyltransferase family 2 protein [Shewanella oncorhynchi]|uniref:glycosyltransferase family 2 protein n=1 Tax=Shewanella oncorhynchi TaxID=2726434 RepID=UPI003D7AE392
MSVYISVVSHGHGELIKKLACLNELAKKFIVVVKVNKYEKGLVSYLKLNNIECIDESYGIGFGHNNNVVYKYCKDKLSMGEDDHFLVVNPDVIADSDAIDALINLMLADNTLLAGVNLFKDDNYLMPDNSIRNFPSLFQFVKSFLGMRNASINKALVKDAKEVDWAAGSFLAFKSSHYGLLKGFDENYFMYCEDIDICFRSNRLGVPVIFYPQIKIIHLAEHANRTILSKHFFWHISSVVRFLLTKQDLTNASSCIQ